MPKKKKQSLELIDTFGDDFEVSYDNDDITIDVSVYRIFCK